ncbi:MAG TPA: hypothetical protein VER17_20335 [Tepidisphaeraceae bacterium]|nr:hypothetical protein [Tepidisphaeraceae bacterium]
MLLDRFGDGDDAHDCEYVGRTCLLAPPVEPDDVARATALIDRALVSESARQTWQYRFLRMAKALAEYRADRYESAIATVQGEPARVFGPVPDMIIAMAQSRLGRATEARQALARAALSYDWSPSRATRTSGWR